MKGPLSSLKVLDFSTLLPGPFASLLLADMGAEVLRIESPTRVDLTRVLPPHVDGVSASHAYLNRLTPQAGGWKGLRLDHGPNVTTGGSTNWHWNQSGAKNAFGIADHTLASPAASRFGQVMKYAKPLGRVGMGLGIAMDGLSLGQNINESRKTGNWGNTVEEGSRIAGGWGGAWLGAKGGGALGATIGSFICPGIGTAIGGALGGLAGGIGGYLGGSKLGKWLGSKL